ncbi:pantoate--beta-alanine ligase [Nitrosospira sp. Is2]|uniref:pantoate--beta-alanine ligase n=1 Tax=Nitrosospira sp. Is2 TaxID=3080532 RepID=UPI00295435C8|nr:pantoate--beta-alanine ligase [Nitrosospira sp. Is2]WON75465.1 pantoate--beta-alanine ligase [Nitrosospira sp. Is2]
MDVLSDISSLRERLKRESSVSLVPTMGGLHDGHLSLVHLARMKADCVVTSIFVNRLQFSPTEDFDRYPRALADDCKLLEQWGTSVVFAPSEHTLYPVLQEFMVEPPPLANSLEGEFRPGFFRGVATVVLKLFNIVQPQIAVFGKKDYQQLHLVRELVRQFNYSLEIVAGETVRAPDNLALSSRNRYLTPETRAEAARLYQVLAQVKCQIEKGNTCFDDLERNATGILFEHGWKTDYISVRHAHTLAPAHEGDEDMVVLGAAQLRGTRLIDNVELHLES